eukprot:2298066-Pyramimonas_sp.AAC.2
MSRMPFSQSPSPVLTSAGIPCVAVDPRPLEVDRYVLRFRCAFVLMDCHSIHTCALVPCPHPLTQAINDKSYLFSGFTH